MPAIAYCLKKLDQNHPQIHFNQMIQNFRSISILDSHSRFDQSPVTTAQLQCSPVMPTLPSCQLVTKLLQLTWSTRAPNMVLGADACFDVSALLPFMDGFGAYVMCVCICVGRGVGRGESCWVASRGSDTREYTAHVKRDTRPYTEHVQQGSGNPYECL